jgi:DNA-binding transcriptional MerR regulator
MTAQEWTLDELIGKVAEQLDDDAYAGAPNGRVRDVPDARAVRWYSTIGLVDRPVMRGRTAWYGPRHLLQLVAIKRRQSAGFKIAEIQAELAEAPDDVLQSIAAVALPKAAPDQFWLQHPAEYIPGPHGAPHVQPESHGTPGLLSGVPLGGGAVLLLNTTPNEDDLVAIRAAARELMNLLAARGLVTPHELTPHETTTRRGSAT